MNRLLPPEPTRAMLNAWREVMRGVATHRRSTIWPNVHYSDSEALMVEAYQAMLKAAPKMNDPASTAAARLEWLGQVLSHCPHAELTYNDDKDEGPVGWRLLIESCSTLDLRAPTLEALIDLGMKAKADEDGNVVAQA